MNDGIALGLKNISFKYRKDLDFVIKDFSLEVEKGSFTTLLGSSGSGKTTILRLISGFLQQNEGQILINGADVNGIPPENRKIGMVFQDYALFPHMNVEQNILYGLKLKNRRNPKNERLSKEEIIGILSETAKSLDIEKLMNRFPHELSGGQQQRVALARALVLQPEILLMDEPLSSLDTKLRQTVRTELKEIQKKLKITTVYVTHDQEEALSLSDKIAVLHNGKLLQYDTGTRIYFEPNDCYTAEFIGKANIIGFDGNDGFRERKFLVRPEWIKIVPLADGTDAGDCQKKFAESADGNEEKYGLKGTVVNADFLGGKIRYAIESEKGKIIADSSSLNLEEIKIGSQVHLEFLHIKEM